MRRHQIITFRILGIALIIVGALLVPGPRLFGLFAGTKVRSWESLLFDPVRVGWALLLIISGALTFWAYRSKKT